MSKDLLVIYRNYLFALQTIQEHGNKYGDEDVIKIYEEKLIKAKVLKNKQWTPMDTFKCYTKYSGQCPHSTP